VVGKVENALHCAQFRGQHEPYFQFQLGTLYRPLARELIENTRIWIMQLPW
jgi:hypothetical protein